MDAGNVVTVPAIPHSRPWITESDRGAVNEVLTSGMIASGEATSEFESRVAAYLGTPHAVAQASGTASLVTALRALLVGPGDEVILPTYVCRSVLEAVLWVGAQPRLCDVSDTGVVSRDSVVVHLRRSTKAIIAVHLFGHPCAISDLRELQIPVIEDACQAFGLVIDGRRAGTIGDIGILSFHATKCLATGEGGMLVTESDELAERARGLIRGRQLTAGRNAAPMSDLQAALGLAQLLRYPSFLERRVALRQQFSDAAAALGLRPAAPSEANALFRFTFRSTQPFENLRRRFLNRAVHVRRGVDELLHRTLGLDDAQFPTAARLFSETVSLPFYPSLSEEEVSIIVGALDLLQDVR